MLDGGQGLGGGSVEPEVALLVNGEQHLGWKDVSIRMGIEELCPSFSLSFVDKWSAGSKALPIREDDDCEIKIVGGLSRLNDAVLTGVIDKFSGSYDKQSRKTTVVGRSITRELYDCSAIHEGNTIKGKTFAQIAEALCDPFLLDVEVDTLLTLDADFQTAIERHRFHKGESPFEVMQKFVKQLGVVVHTTPTGKLRITKPPKAPLLGVEIRLGENVEACQFTGDATQRFSHYSFLAQAPGTDNSHGTQCSQVESSGDAMSVAGPAASVGPGAPGPGRGAKKIENALVDADVRRYRPMLVCSERGDAGRVGRRALWERNTRAAKSVRLSYTVRGWTNPRGLWQPNTLVAVVDDYYGFDEAMLVVHVELRRNASQGRVAVIDVVGAGAYDVLATPPRARGGRKPNAVRCVEP